MSSTIDSTQTLKTAIPRTTSVRLPAKTITSVSTEANPSKIYCNLDLLTMDPPGSSLTGLHLSLTSQGEAANLWRIRMHRWRPRPMHHRVRPCFQPYQDQ